MQLPPLKYLFWFILLLCSGCQSSRPSLLFSRNSATATSAQLISGLPVKSADSASYISVSRVYKTVAQTPEKVIYAANLPRSAFVFSPPKLAKKYLPDSTAVNAHKKGDQPGPDPTRKNPYPEHEHRLSGIFIGLGMATLLASLVLLLVGSGAAGTVAIIGGIIFIIGFIICMDSLLGD